MANREAGCVISSNYREGEIQLSAGVVRINSSAAAVSESRRIRGNQDTPDSTMADDKSSLPPGWDAKFDARTGKL